MGVAKHYGHAVDDQHIPLHQSVGGAAAGLEVRVHSRILISVQVVSGQSTDSSETVWWESS